MNLNLPKGSTILDVGCCRSKIAIELASLGYIVTANDLKYYKYRHPNLTFVQGDLRFLRFTNRFDMVTAVSTIEHTGLGSYKEKKSVSGDKEMISKIYNILKKKGMLILTVPFGKKEVIEDVTRIYNYESLRLLLKKFKVLKMEFYKGLNRNYWVPADYKELIRVSSKHKSFVQGVACVVAQKAK